MKMNINKQRTHFSIIIQQKSGLNSLSKYGNGDKSERNEVKCCKP